MSAPHEMSSKPSPNAISQKGEMSFLPGQGREGKRREMKKLPFVDSFFIPHSSSCSSSSSFGVDASQAAHYSWHSTPPPPEQPLMIRSTCTSADGKRKATRRNKNTKWKNSLAIPKASSIVGGSSVPPVTGRGLPK